MIISMSYMFSHNYINIFLIGIAICIVLLSISLISNVSRSLCLHIIQAHNCVLLEFVCISTGVLV